MVQAFNKVLNWRAAIGRRAMAVTKAYFGDKTIFETMNEIGEHAKWLLPSQDMNEGEGTDMEEVDEGVASIEEVVRQRKRKFVGAPFLWENGLIGVAGDEPVCKLSHSRTYEVHLTLFPLYSRQVTVREPATGKPRTDS